MRGFYGSWLAIDNPGPFASRLAGMATYRRKGRIPKGEEREVRFYHRGPMAIWLPRGLLAEARRLIPGLQVADRTLAFRRISFGWRGQLRPEQAWAVDRVLTRGGGVVVAPPGSGKTHVALALAASLGQPTLWVTHTKDLARDARDRARQLFNLPRGAIGYIAERQVSIGTHLTVATVQTLTKRPDLVKELANRTGLVISDESHHDSSLSRSRLVSQFPARWRCGLTATPDRTDGLEDLFHDLFGGIAANIPLEYGFKQKRLIRPSVHLIRTGWRTYDSVAWDVLQRARAASGSRNAILCKIAKREFVEGRHVMILTELVDHAHYLAEVLPQYFGVPTVAVVGDVAPIARERAYARMERGEAVLVATKLADEGLDLPALDTLILATPGRSQPRLRQQVGRTMRIFRGKSDARVYDLVDSEVPVLQSQAEARVEEYDRMGLPVRRQ